MKDLEDIERYLAMMARSKLTDNKVGQGIHPFVTISRQFGARGHSLANAILDRMRELREFSIFDGWQILDKEMCKKILAERNLNVSFDALLAEEYYSQIEDFLSLIGGTVPPSAVRLEIFKLIRKLAILGKVIVVGLGGACLTRDLPYGVHVRLAADQDTRVRHMMGLLELTDKEARKVVAQRDRERAKLIKSFFSKDIDDPLLYDTICNTDRVPLEEIADLIIGLIAIKAEKAGFAGTQTLLRQAVSLAARSPQ